MAAVGDSSSLCATICTPIGVGIVEVGDNVIPRQGDLPLSSHACLAWEAHSCGPAGPCVVS
jgi:hypothetical protein